MKMLVTIRSAIVVRSLVRGIIVGKAKRKPRPSMPDWFWWGKTGAGSANKEMVSVTEVVYSNKEQALGVKRLFPFNYDVIMPDDSELRDMLVSLVAEQNS